MTMLLHTVELDYSALDAQDGIRLDALMSSLNRISSVRWVAVGRSLTDEHARMLTVAVADTADLEAYRRDPVHVEVARELRAAGLSGIKHDWHFDRGFLAAP